MFTDEEILIEEEYRKQLLDEGAFSTIVTAAATALGYSSLTLFAGLGAALVVKSSVSKEGKIKKFFKKIFGKKRDIEFDDIKGKSVAKREIEKTEFYKERLHAVYKAIEAKDWDKAAELFKSSRYANDTDAIKAVAIKITEVVGEPPLFVGVNGNETYFIMKKILGMKYAKAMAQSVVTVLKRNSNYYDKMEV